MVNEVFENLLSEFKDAVTSFKDTDLVNIDPDIRGYLPAYIEETVIKHLLFINVATIGTTNFIKEVDDLLFHVDSENYVGDIPSDIFVAMVTTYAVRSAIMLKQQYKQTLLDIVKDMYRTVQDLFSTIEHYKGFVPRNMSDKNSVTFYDMIALIKIIYIRKL